MNNSKGYITGLLILFQLLLSCTKQDENLILNEDFLFVADVLEYCQGPCSEFLNWENNEILVKGYIPNVANDSIVQEYYDQGRFYFSDIRNGMFMEIRVKEDTDAIFEILNEIQKKDMVFIRGIAESVIVNEGNECTKGVIIELTKSENINTN